MREPDPHAVRAIEAVAARAWPAAEVALRDGWWLRAGPDETWRTRSVLPQPSPPGVAASPLDARIAEVEAFYAARALPARFQLHDAASPDDLASTLVARGYLAGKPTDVLTGALDRVVEGSASTPPSDVVLSIGATADAAWLDAYGRLHGYDAATLDERVALFGRIAGRRLHARAERGGEPVGVGFVVCEDGRAGLFGLATAPALRRRGVARALLHALFAGARERGADEAYLQVEAANAGARILYARCGFTRHHGYRYLTADGGAARRG